MRAKVTEQGVTIPKSLLPDVDEVEIRERNSLIEVAPADGDRRLALEDANGRLTSEIPTRESSDNDGPIAQTYLTLWKSFYASGHFNVPLYFDKEVRPDEGPITLALGEGKREIQAYLSRSETPHGIARIKGGAALQDWFEENYRVEEKILVSYDAPNKITLGGQSFESPSTDSIRDLGKDPIPAEELDISDASVNLDKYIYGE